MKMIELFEYLRRKLMIIFYKCLRFRKTLKILKNLFEKKIIKNNILKMIELLEYFTRKLFRRFHKCLDFHSKFLRTFQHFPVLH